MFKGLKLVIIDEFSMIFQYHLFHIDQRLREICACDKSFGGVTVVLFGDPGQIPPVKGSSCWNEIFPNTVCGENDRKGYMCYLQFQVVTKLIENCRVNRDRDSATFYHEFLQRMRTGDNTSEDWRRMNETCSKVRMRPGRWEEEGFTIDKATYLFTRNKVSFLCVIFKP